MKFEMMRKGPLLLAGAMSAALVTGCGDDASGSQGNQSEPLYVMMSQVYDTSDRTIFYPVSNTLDITGHVSLAGVHQEPGVANLQTADGKVLISSGQSPRVARYIVDDDFQWIEDGAINFTGYNLPEDGANFFNQFMLDDDTAYLMRGGSFDRIVWNPTTMTIIGAFTDETLPEPPAGMTFSGSGNRANIRYPERVRQVFSASGEVESDSVSYLVEYDETTHLESKVTTINCPGVAIASLQEDGDVVYSGYPDAGLLSLFGIGAEPCAVIVGSDLEVKETIDIRDFTGGYTGGNIRYLRDGYALAAVLRHDRLTGDYDFASGVYDPAIQDELWLDANWDLWILDLDAGTGVAVEGLHTYYPQTEIIDGRAFVMQPNFDDAVTTVYELTSAGQLVERFTVEGDLFKWIRVR